MIRIIIPVTAFIVLLFLAVIDIPTSVVPGWHINLYPSWFVWGVLVMLILFLGGIGLWLRSKNADKATKLLFALHFFLTIATVMYLRFPMILLRINLPFEADFSDILNARIKLIPIAWLLFTAAQFLFPIYILKAIRARQSSGLN